MRMEHWWNDTEREKTEVLEGKPVLVPACPTQISPGIEHGPPKSFT